MTLEMTSLPGATLYTRWVVTSAYITHTHTHTHTLTGGWCVHLWLSPRQQPLPRQWMWQLLCLCMGPQTQEYHQNISSNLLCNLFITSPTPSHPLPHTHSLTHTPSHTLPHTHSSLTHTPSHTLPHTHSLTPTPPSHTHRVIVELSTVWWLQAMINWWCPGDRMDTYSSTPSPVLVRVSS